MPIKSFRGMLSDNDQDKILLHTNTGSTGYRIVKFQIIPNAPGTVAQESICKIYKIQQADNIPAGTNLYSKIDFSENILLAAAYYADGSSAGDNQATTVIFDNEIFNQDIFITHKDVSGNDPGAPINYYIELEQIKLDLNENTVATLKDIRNIESQ
tara:strand:- start:216 stop:683 length:468 start_codon:yes stop_codon:yes gene_type:complete